MRKIGTTSTGTGIVEMSVAQFDALMQIHTPQQTPSAQPPTPQPTPAPKAQTAAPAAKKESPAVMTAAVKDSVSSMSQTQLVEYVAKRICNPGVQGSNTFVATRHLMAIGGFDETFPSCADRELMIRLLDLLAATTIEVIQDPLVYHHNHKNVRVSLDLTGKHLALDLLYAKYKARFSQQAYFKSVERATRFFGYKGVL